MKHLFKTIISIILTAVCILTFASCGKKSETPYEKLSDYLAENGELSKVDDDHKYKYTIRYNDKTEQLEIEQQLLDDDGKTVNGVITITWNLEDDDAKINFDYSLVKYKLDAKFSRKEATGFRSVELKDIDIETPESTTIDLSDSVISIASSGVATSVANVNNILSELDFEVTIYDLGFGVNK